ncbi:hypothetical protein AB0B30_32915 [Streptomyces narbonensis]|uniref:Uncharacterized protein n=1 Tax=Streptomyces narbonensis TaxID=67333 RepID=A0ABV3CIP7_9ACTN
MECGVTLPDYGPEGTPDALAGRALRVETLGIRYAMVSDHVALTPDVLETLVQEVIDVEEGCVR